MLLPTGWSFSLRPLSIENEIPMNPCVTVCSRAQALLRMDNVSIYFGTGQLLLWNGF